MNKILHGDSLELLKDLDDNSVDSVVTDPPYGYSFMGKDWDKALPDINIWKECVRVLKPGGFAFIMTAPRSDVHSRMCLMLEEAGFRIDFTPIAWTYATGFPKAMNIGKMVDKRLGVKREVIGVKKRGDVEEAKKRGTTFTQAEANRNNKDIFGYGEEELTSGPASDEAKKLDGSYAGYQPKPAWENVIVCMKPLSEKGYLDQALKDGKGVTWLDDLRIPFQGEDDYPGWWESGAKGSNGYLGTDTFKIRDRSAEEIKNAQFKKTTKRKPRKEGTVFKTSGFKSENNDTAEASPFGRFAANLLVQDDVLNDGKTTKSTGGRSYQNTNDMYSGGWKHKDKGLAINPGKGDEGSFSRYYDLDAWWEERIKELPLNVQTTYPFMIVPKASKSEKNKGMEKTNIEPKVVSGETNEFGKMGINTPEMRAKRGVTTKLPEYKNFHPTVKPISLMSYLITMGSRENDLVLDPFVGSGTTCIAAKLLNRKYLGMEMDDEYVVIAKARIKAHKSKKQKHSFF